MNLPNLEKILQNPDTELKAQIQNQMREQQLKQAIEAKAKLICENSNGSWMDMCIESMELVLQNPSILRHADPEIMKKAGWIRQEDYQKAIDGLKKCMDSIDFPRSFAQATLIDLKEL